MKFSGPAWAAAVFFWASIGPADAAATAVGHPVRIVTLAPSLGEIAADLAGPDLQRIVGVSEYTDEPAGLKSVKSVGSYPHVNLEAIAALHPDLILATQEGNAKDQIEHLRELNLNVVLVRSTSFKDLEDSIDTVATAMGEQTRGAQLNARLRAGLGQIEGHARTRDRHPSVLLEIADDPLVVVGSGTFLNEAIALVGAKNVYGDLGNAYPRPSVEDTVKRDPDVIVIASVDPAAASKSVKAWQRFPKLKAVANGKVRVVKSDALLRPSPRVVEGIVALERAIYGHP